MEKLHPTTKAIMEERFGKDSLIALATSQDNTPHVRTVNAFYDDGAFYVLTYALSDKMRQLAANPAAAVCGEWFSGQGRGVSLGWVKSEENREIAEKMKRIFALWLGNGHVDLADENTVILRIELSFGVLFSNGTRYDIDFTE